MESSDKLVVDTAEARNGLEEYVTRLDLSLRWLGQSISLMTCVSSL
jgi:hypothetical protein